MDITYFVKYRSLLEKVLREIENLGIGKDNKKYINIFINLKLKSPFRRIDGRVVYVYEYPIVESLQNELCNSCVYKEVEYVCCQDYGEEQLNNLLMCRCAVPDLSRRLDYFKQKKHSHLEISTNIMYKCCSICGQYLYGGTPSLRCMNPDHYKFEHKLMMDEDLAYLKYLFRANLTMNPERSIFPSYQFRVYSNLFTVLSFHLETKYFFFRHRDLFEIVCDFLEYNFTYSPFNRTICSSDFLRISYEIFDHHAPPNNNS
jgi:hypothetical protein